MTKKEAGETAGAGKASGRRRGSGFTLLAESAGQKESADEELPRDEAGRVRIKRQYEDLLGVRVSRLAGRILNRERIDKVQEGIYFVCAACRKVCHNLDDGLVEDAQNQNNRCQACSLPIRPRS